ncbi:MAG: lysylphosphatidylglycerol synthase transmembrane domain-containing protein [Candidatus Cyclobacteriaceae bacterium M2_1C_046]
MHLEPQKILKTLNPRKAWLPAAIGIGFIVIMILTDEDIDGKKLNLIFQAEAWPVVLAFLTLFLKEAAYIYRIRVLTDEEITWTGSVYVILLWEFASAVTPTVVGGTPVAVFILLKEGINLGKSLAYVMLTAILDNMFFVVAATIALLISMGDILPNIADAETKLGKSLPAIFITSYSLIAFYTLIMALALFYKPRLFKWVLIKITSIGFLRRWRYAAYQHGNEVMWASSYIKGRKKRYWLKISMATIVAWVCRYTILNFLIMAYTDKVSILEHVTIFGKHLILWIVMLFSPTPGSSGTAEYFFPRFFDIYLGEYAFGVAILWRAISYYPYLIIGAFLLPKWIQRVFIVKKKDVDKNISKED